MDQSTYSTAESVHERYQEQSVHEDIEEGIHRMMDEGGGVVSQCEPEGAPILRNHLVKTDRYTS